MDKPTPAPQKPNKQTQNVTETFWLEAEGTRKGDWPSTKMWQKPKYCVLICMDIKMKFFLVFFLLLLSLKLNNFSYHSK